MSSQEIKLDAEETVVGTEQQSADVVREECTTEEDTATEIFEPGEGIAEVMHALDNEVQDEILPVTLIPYLQPFDQSRNRRHPS